MCKNNYSIKCIANKQASKILMSYSNTFSFLKIQFYAIQNFFAF